MKSNITLVDTSAWIETMRPKGDASVRAKVSGLLRAGQAAWCEIIKLELWNGAFAREMPDLEELEQNVVLLEITPKVWDRASKLSRKARTSGKTFLTVDLVIFACAEEYGAEIVHRDGHFEKMKAL